MFRIYQKQRQIRRSYVPGVADGAYYPKETTMEEASPYINYYNKPCSISSTCGMPVTRLVCICAEARINKRMILFVLWKYFIEK